ncbi:MAG: DegT/DnrJ/EryC1/StrS family aminotransferase [Candidatus Nealsonbacteria bacterium]|nr:DegT/DnrJ/EryC1/StrS family aminotransferase [Candidatus Nealsonbacteria bacterium]
MYFVHPQIKFNIGNIKKVVFSFIKSSDPAALKKLEGMFPGKEIVFTDMGRSAFKLIIESFNLQNSKMLVPAYICDVFYPIFKQYHISPVFLDADKETFNISGNELKEKITPETKSILVSHTYGLPVNIGKIREIAGSQVLVIEDCAHSFGNKTGNAGDASFFSLYKSFPTSRGGMAILPKNMKAKDLPKTCFNPRDFLSLLNSFSIFAYIFKQFGSGIAKTIPRKEKLTQPSLLNRVSMNLFLNLLDDFEKVLPQRIKLALFFQSELKKLGFEVQDSQNNVFTYLSALVPENTDRDGLVKKLRKHNIFCTRIWHTPIVFNPEVQKEYSLNLAGFPNTIDISKRVINFPLQNFYTEKDIRKMALALTKSINAL